MKPLTNLAIALSGLIFIFLASPANAIWNLHNDDSRLSFISIKKDKVAEVHKFTHLSGSIDAQGQVDVVIQLASVDTAVPIRDERMRDMLFQTDLFPKATVSGKVDISGFTKLAVGQFRTEKIELSLSLHGQSKTIKAEVGVVKLQGGSLMVTTIQPIVVNAADFDLEKGVEELMKIADLPAINAAVPVTLNLVFNEKP